LHNVDGHLSCYQWRSLALELDGSDIAPFDVENIMRIAVASSGEWLDSVVDYHTGRAAFFILYDTDQESCEAIDNWRCIKILHWAGSRAVKLLVEARTQAVIVRHIGPCAFRRLSDANISVFLADEDTVVRAIRRFREGELAVAEEPNCHGHSHPG
jgi:predicted Fe-Mo cluster-binding NifX family protein